MQQYGHIIVGGLRVNVLVRRKKNSITMKVANGKDNALHHFSDEQHHLDDTPEKLNRLLNGKTIEC